jgi:hypothetical protein
MLRLRSLALGAALTAGLVLPGAHVTSAADAPPSYTVQFLGDGTPTSMNDVGTVVGTRVDQTTLRNVPLVSRNGGTWEVLPLPAGHVGGFAMDVNDAGVVVGTVEQSTIDTRRAARWTPTAGGYTVDLLPLLPGELRSLGTAINDAGQIVGVRSGLFGLPSGFGWLYSDATGIVDLNATYGWFATPNDINDAGVVLSGTQTLDLATGTVFDVGALDTTFGLIGGEAINDAGQIVGLSLSSGSLPTARLHRYTPGSGWTFITGSSRYTTASDINNSGTITYGEGLTNAPGLYIDGLGTLALNSLIDPAVTGAGWFANGGAQLDDSGRIATTARNSTTFAVQGVLLTPAGAVAPPTAPTGLTATAHPATTAEPYSSIDLSWTGTDPSRTQRFEMERRVAGTTTWSPITLVAPGLGTSHQDTTVASGVRYDYRVRAVGVGGPSDWSATATATAPRLTVVRVAALSLTATLRNGVVTANGIATVRTSSGAAVSGATVTGTWTRPGGSTVTASATTDSRGQARLTTTGGRGTYRLTITGVSKPGTTFDAAASVLTKTIRK